MSAKRPIPFVVIVVCLLVAGALLFALVEQLQAVVSTPRAYDGPASDLHTAVASADPAAVRREIDRGLDPDARYEGSPAWRQGMTGLMIAAHAGDAPVASTLIELGANIESRGPDGRTALIYAAGWGGTDVLDALIQGGARVDARDEDKWTALMMAAGRGDASSVEALIDAGANVDSRNRWGQTALMRAAEAGALDKVGVLLDAGARVAIRDEHGRDALSLACASDAPPEVLELLLGNGARTDTADVDDVTPLMLAADRGDADKVIVLLNAGANPSARDLNGWAASDWAASREDDAGTAIAEMLAEASR